MSKQLLEIRMTLRSMSNKGVIEAFKKVAPGAVKIHGVKTPELNILAAQYKSGSFELAEELWVSGYLEERIIAVKILEKTGKSDPQRLLRLFKQFSKTVDNWAVCDGLGMQFLRGITKTHSKEIFEIAAKFSQSPNLWQRRLALVMVEWYTRLSEYHSAIKKLVSDLENDEEYYVRKAVSWIKRNFNKGK